MNPYPNIILILADDMGYGDVTCYDPEYNKVPTPHIDRLAGEGMRFTNCHTTSSLCTPSRYGLLTGRYAWRTRLQRGVLMEQDGPLIAQGRQTVADLLKARGYQTACIGKWHLGLEWRHREGKPLYDEPFRGGPIDRGFDSYFGIDVPNFPPYAWIEDDRVLGEIDAYYDRDEELCLNHPGVGVKDWPFDEVLPKITERAVAKVEEYARGESPFFLYFSLTTPHEPIAPSKRFKGKSGISGVADLIMETDWAVGEVMRALEEQGIADNTLLIFTTDNGHCPYTHLAPFEKVGHRVSGPLRGYKADIWEGGHRVPFVARWPEVTPAGSVCDELMSLADFMATCASISGGEVSPSAGEDSFDALPLLRGEHRPIRESAVFHSGHGYFAVIRDNWKLSLCWYSGGSWNPEVLPENLPPIQLHDLSVDLGERRNLQAEHPEKVAELTALLEQAVYGGRTTPGAPCANEVQIDIWKKETVS